MSQFPMHFVIRFNLRAPPAAACSGSLPVRAAPARPVPETPEHAHLRNSRSIPFPDSPRRRSPAIPALPAAQHLFHLVALLQPAHLAQVGIAHQDHVAQGRKVRREPHRHRVGRASLRSSRSIRPCRSGCRTGSRARIGRHHLVAGAGRSILRQPRPSSPAAGRCRPTKSNRNSPYLQCGRWHGTPY